MRRISRLLFLAAFFLFLHPGASSLQTRNPATVAKPSPAPPTTENATTATPTLERRPPHPPDQRFALRSGPDLGLSTTVASGSTVAAAPNSSSATGTRRWRPAQTITCSSNDGKRNYCDSFGASPETSFSSARSVVRPAFAAVPGASITVASGSTAAAAPSSPSAAETGDLALDLDLNIARSPAPPTTASETTARCPITRTQTMSS